MNIPAWRATLFPWAFAAWSVGFSFVFLPMLLVARRHVPKLYKPWSAGCAWLLQHMCGITFQVKGGEHIRQHAAIIACKHQSAMDIVLLTACIDYPCFILKRELTWIPVWGWFLKSLGNVAIDRSKGKANMDNMLKQSRDFLHAGRPIVVFPEGTRVPAGERRKILPGVAMMADDLKVPVVPAVLNTGLFWPKSKLPIRSGTCILEFLPAIPAGTPPRQLLKTLQQAIDNHTTMLEQQAIVG